MTNKEPMICRWCGGIIPTNSEYAYVKLIEPSGEKIEVIHRVCFNELISRAIEVGVADNIRIQVLKEN